GWFELDAIGRWEYTIEAWWDRFGTWRDELERKVGAGQPDLDGELSEGALLIEEALNAATTARDKSVLSRALELLNRSNDWNDSNDSNDSKDSNDSNDPNDLAHDRSAKLETALDRELEETVERIQPRHGTTELELPLVIDVDRLLARFGAWYELFPRSW